MPVTVGADSVLPEAAVGDHETVIIPPLIDGQHRLADRLDAQVAGQVHAQAGGIRVAGRLLTTNSKVFVPATSPLVIVNEVKLAKPGLVMPLLTPLTKCLCRGYRPPTRRPP